MKYTQLLPFMDEQELMDVATEIISGNIKNIRIEKLYPFLKSEDLNNLVDKLIEAKEVSSLHSVLPFISKEKVFVIYRAAEQGQLEGFDQSSCLPFLDSSMVKEIFRDLIKKANDETDDES